MKKNRGFTLTELLVVIAIIGLLTSVALGSLKEARAKARNTQRNAFVQSQKLGMELAFDTYNQFPNPGPSTSNYTCLGKYANGVCWSGSYANSATLDAIMNGFVPGDAAPDITNLYYYGLLYYYNPVDPNYYVFLWFLEGTNRNCAPAGVTFYADYNGDTYCRFDR